MALIQTRLFQVNPSTIRNTFSQGRMTKGSATRSPTKKNWLAGTAEIGFTVNRCKRKFLRVTFGTLIPNDHRAVGYTSITQWEKHSHSTTELKELLRTKEWQESGCKLTNPDSGVTPGSNSLTCRRPDRGNTSLARLGSDIPGCGGDQTMFSNSQKVDLGPQRQAALGKPTSHIQQLYIDVRLA